MPSDRHSVRSDLSARRARDGPGEQVTPMEFRSLHCPRAIERTLLRSTDNPTHWPRGEWYSRSLRTVSSADGIEVSPVVSASHWESPREYQDTRISNS